MRAVDDITFWRIAAGFLGAGFIFLAIFVAWPEVDLWAAAQFFRDGDFVWGREWPARWLRQIYHLVFVAACASAIIGLIGVAMRRSGACTPVRNWVFMALLFTVGPGFLANAILKENWGRARPAQIVDFGGDRVFTVPFQIADQCQRNCSFVSGEGSAAAAVAAAAVVLFWPLLRSLRARLVAVAALAIWLVGAAFIRMAPGRHFLSDTLFSFVLVGLVALALYGLLDMGRARVGVTPATMSRDLRGVMIDLAAWLEDGWRRLRARLLR